MRIPNPRVFREYDIRGVADRDFSDEFVRDIGRSFGSEVRDRGGQRIVLSRDCRLSSSRLHEALLEGLLETGLHVVDIGVGPTPLLYFTVFVGEADGGVQITGSHNPPDENGFKLMLGRLTLAGDEIQRLRQRIERGHFARRAGGRLEKLDAHPLYCAFMRENLAIDPTRAPKFAIDAGNGAGGPLALDAMRAVGLSPLALLCDMDGHFPVHHPDPSQPENTELLVSTVKNEKLAFGIAFDGDADRIGLIDDRGRVVYGDKLMILLGRDVLGRRPGAAILGEVKCSQTMYDDIARHGGRPILWKTGHSLIKRKMKEEGALLAGEMSGHVFFADRYFGFDDAIYAALRVVEIATRAQKPLSALLADVPETCSTPELRVPCDDDVKFDVVARVLSHYRASHDVVDVDGARVRFDGGWGLVRASNTQPVLVLRFEAQSEARLAEIRADVEGVVATARGQRPASAAADRA